MTSHDLALNLQKTAVWLLSKESFPLSEFDAHSYQYLSFTKKEEFLAAVKAVGSGKKKFSDTEITFEVEAPWGIVKLTARRETVCRLIRPAEYDCASFLSPEEEAALGGGQ